MRPIFGAALFAAAVLGCAPSKAGHVEGVSCSQLPAATGGVTRPSGSCVNTVVTVPSGATVQDAIHQQFVVSTAPVTFTSNITLATITGLSIPLAAGKTYNCSGHLTVTGSGASGGIKVALVGTGGLTATSSSFTASNFNGITTNARTTTTILGTAIGLATAVVTDIEIVGAIVVNVAGTINVQAAQNVSNATSTVVGANSVFSCVRVN